jgi:hypothetical protein
MRSIRYRWGSAAPEHPPDLTPMRSSSVSSPVSSLSRLRFFSAAGVTVMAGAAATADAAGATNTVLSQLCVSCILTFAGRTIHQLQMNISSLLPLTATQERPVARVVLFCGTGWAALLSRALGALTLRTAYEVDGRQAGALDAMRHRILLAQVSVQASSAQAQSREDTGSAVTQRDIAGSPRSQINACAGHM